MNRNSVFEIKVALLGFVSVGKTTILNAIFREQYSEVGKQRKTAAVNHFRVSKREDKKRKDSDCDRDTADLQNSKHWKEPASGDTPRSAESTLQEIMNDNLALRDCERVHEKFFDISLDEGLCKMRDDTSLVFIDIPGINEAGAGNKFRDYVATKWVTFDCVIVVIDGGQGIIAQETVTFLKFVKDNLIKRKNLPVIIVSNKVDDPDDEDSLVHETQAIVQDVFGVGDRANALTNLLKLNPMKALPVQTSQFYPALIPLSAIHAFIYQTGAFMDLEKFKKLDRNLIDKLGGEILGRLEWKQLSEDEKYSVAHRAVSDLSKYRERLAATNFDKFLTVLSNTLGAEAQTQLLINQVKRCLKNINSIPGITAELELLTTRCRALGLPTDDITRGFWESYDKLEERAKKSLTKPSDVACLCSPFKELLEYYGLMRHQGLKEEEARIVGRMQKLIRFQFLTITNAERKHHAYRDETNVFTYGDLDWHDLNAEDWKTLCRSMLLLSFNKYFCMTFGAEIMQLQSLIDNIVVSATCFQGNEKKEIDVASTKCRLNASKGKGKTAITPERCNVVHSESRLVRSKTKTVIRRQYHAPESFKDCLHWGHLAWKFCELMDANSASS